MRHDGICGFCGSDVRNGFDTCAHCSAMWARGFTSQGRKKGLLILLASGVLAVLSMILHNSATGSIFGFLSVMTFLAMILGRFTFLKSWAWFKSV
ncbi:hypothetical protein FZ983_28535 [Azospirillum sp. B21]|uniref:hypothetical protein n=1 Tax=Azospirillum sp. B21 TaxID=2607496 RepID=UPI0011EEEEB0|nr:hypothetical protein [Azospirillum sp. B21]KAA0574200.1 hypothetical protein FZ983_28535 [Azospirillum sp. B21]